MGEERLYPIIVKSLDWSYGDRKVLQDISLKIEKNKFYSIIGPNGSGKTTLLKNISKSLEPDKNRVFIRDTDLTRLKIRESE